MSGRGESFNPLHEHWRCTLNRVAVKEAEMSGCFCCKRVFNSCLIREWTDDGRTAVCPYCCADTVIPETAELELTPEWLRAMHDYWMAPA